LNQYRFRPAGNGLLFDKSLNYEGLRLDRGMEKGYDKGCTRGARSFPMPWRRFIFQRSGLIQTGVFFCFYLPMRDLQRLSAIGAMTVGSLLIIGQDISDHRHEYLCILRALRDIAFPFDAILITGDYYQSTEDVVGGITSTVNKEGRVLYAAA